MFSQSNSYREKRKSLSAAASTLDQDQLQIREFFASIDQNGDNAISSAELKVFVEQHMESRDQDEIQKGVRKIMELCDTDNSDSISFNEFWSHIKRAPGVRKSSLKLMVFIVLYRIT